MRGDIQTIDELHKSMEQIKVDPSAAKKPPSYLPGVHDPKSPMRPGKMKIKMTKKSEVTKGKKCDTSDDESDITKSLDTVLDGIFADTLQKSGEERVLIACPHCDTGITKSQILEKAKGGKAKKMVSANNGGRAQSGPGSDGKHNTNTPTRTAGAQAPTNEPNPGNYAKSGKSDDDDAVQKSGGPIVAGSRYVQYMDTGEDALLAKSIEESTLRGISRPSHNGR